MDRAGRGDPHPAFWLRCRPMRPFRSARSIPLALLALVGAGCAANDDAAGPTESSQREAIDDQVDLDGVSFDVRRDPG